MSMIIQDCGDDLSVSNHNHNQYDYGSDDIDDGMDWGFAMPNASSKNSNQHHIDYNYEIRLEEYILQGMEDISIPNVNEDNDHGTIESEEPLFPLPSIALELYANLENLIMNNSDSDENVIKNNDKFGPIYAPISMFQFHRPCTNEDYFMIKLCFLCDKTTVPHHIADDIVALLQDCRRHSIVRRVLNTPSHPPPS